MKDNISLPNKFMNIQFFQTKIFFQMMFQCQEEEYIIIGKDDVGNFIGLSLDKQVFLLDTFDENTVYISKTIEAFLEEIEIYQQYSKIQFPDNLSDEELKEREASFKELLMQVDDTVCCDEKIYWSYIVEEIGYGII